MLPRRWIGPIIYLHIYLRGIIKRILCCVFLRPYLAPPGLPGVILSKDKKIAKLLIDAEAVVQSLSGISYSLLLIAVKSGDVGVVELLMQYGADVLSSQFSDLSVLETYT